MYDIKRGLIVSCQPDNLGPFCDDAWKFAASSVYNGAVALRVEGLVNIKRISGKHKVIGLIKKNGYITPTIEDGINVFNMGADYVAVGFSNAERFASVVEALCCRGIKVIADIASLDQAIYAKGQGCVAVTTALAGYTNEYKINSEFEAPDIALVDACSKKLSIPVIAEGRYNTLEKVRSAIEAGAHSVCIGAAITLPDYLTRYYSQAFKGI